MGISQKNEQSQRLNREHTENMYKSDIIYGPMLVFSYAPFIINRTISLSETTETHETEKFRIK